MNAVDWPSVTAGAYAGVLGFLVSTAIGIGGIRSILVFGLAWVTVAVALDSRSDVWVAAGRRRLLAVPVVGPLVPTVATTILEDGGIADVALAIRLSLLGLVALGLVVWILGTRVYAEGAAGDSRTC
ncbi:hypothetical protein C491_08008 [Natronococcus amylolyticus DSM 10524]|uniref:Uncharacterized protein n=1 Tax=Natronococcus amylolyticus DSM 10524 TaxID=1227497 RepID=L9XAW3_9EURY|nr:hypothetical protein [Natronococcus amylolyticus]ELY58865.1 hypothetical protein C491_08008 [Natronococcus amylolyticus DSM 10524]